MQQIGLSKNDKAMETAKSLLAIPIGLKGFKPETEQNIVQYTFTAIQKFLQNSLWKSSGQIILHYCFLATFYILRITLKAILGWS